MNNGEDCETSLFNNKEFISEVEKRPAIWDTTTKFYFDKQLKKESWDELVDIFINTENPSEAERIECCRTLQRKWKSCRDCFNRECQRLQKTKLGLATARKSPYVYFNNLSFLHKTIYKNKSIDETENEETSSHDTSNRTHASTINSTDISYNTTDTSTSSLSNTEALSPNYAADTSFISVNDVYSIDDDVALGHRSQRSLKRPKVEIDVDDESELTRLLQPTVQLVEGQAQRAESTSKIQEEDSDRLFLLSLHEPLKQVPKRLRMSVRMKMMQVVDSAMKWGRDKGQD